MAARPTSSATAGERLGSTVGRAMLLPAAASFAVSAAAAGGAVSRRAEDASQCVMVTLSLLLHVLPPVHTLSARGAVSLSWLAAAAVCSSGPAAAARARADVDAAASAERGSNLLLACGLVSLCLTLVRRAPICHY